MPFRKWILSIAAALFPVLGSAVDVAYVLNDNSVVVLDAADPSIVLGTYPTLAGVSMGSQVTVVVNPQGTRLYTAGFLAESSVAAFDIDQTTGLLTLVGIFSAGFSQPFGIAVSPDGSTVFISNFGAHSIDVYNADLSMLYTTVPITGMNPSTIELSPDGAYLYAAYTGVSQIARFDVSSMAPYLTNEISQPSGGANPYVLAVNQDGSLVYITNLSGPISHFNADLSGVFTEVFAVTGLVNPIGIAFDPDGSRIYVGSSGSNEVAVLNPASFVPVIPPLSSQGMGPFSLAINPDGSRLFVTNAVNNLLSVRELIHNTYDPVAGSPFMNVGSQPYRIAFFSSASLGAPEGLRGSQRKNDFGLFYEFFNRLQWQAPSVGTAAGYYVYRNGERIAALLAGSLEYEDHDRPEGSVDLYEVSSFNASGDESAVVYVQVP